MAKRGEKKTPFNVDPSMRIIVLAGKEQYLISEHTRKVIDVLKEEHGDIAQFEYDGETATPAEVLDELRSYGLIQQHKLVILDKADEFLATEGYRPHMEKYAANPVDSATLLMRAETWRPGKIDKPIAKVGMVHKVEPPTTGKAVAWSIQRAKKRYHATVEPDAAERLVELTGPDLARLDTELAKLAAYVGEGNVINAGAVAELVGLSREDKVWALQGPVAEGRTADAMRTFHELFRMSRQVDTTRTLIAWALCDLVRKIHTASQLLRQGANPGSIGSQLKIWGDMQRPIFTAARKKEPAELARLLDLAIRTDLNTKTGIGDGIRSLEVLTVRIADSMRQG